jgi:hypothetical protein
MIGRLALRSLTAHPVRSAVLAVGFGAGVAVMAILLGVAEVVLQQAQSPQLVGGGDVVVAMGRETPASLLLAGTLQAEGLRNRVRVAAPTHTADLYLSYGDARARVDARGGIPSLERALGDPETAGIEGWTDTNADAAWTARSPAAALRQVDRFHPIPDAPAWQGSWAEWLYFNGRSGDTRFYLTFLVGPEVQVGQRASGVRLQLERNGRMESFSDSEVIDQAGVAQAPNLTIGRSSVTLDKLTYRIRLDLAGPAGTRLTGDLSIHATPGRMVPPIEILGARGWRTGYVVPVMSGELEGTLHPPEGDAVLLKGTGYHDHNWGFWKGVSWQWGQVQVDTGTPRALSLLYGRVFPPAEAADPERIPGFVGVLGPDGPLAYATDVEITEANGPDGRPQAIEIRAEGTAIDVTARFDVTSAVTTRMASGPLTNGLDFLQMQGRYTVRGRAGDRTLNFTAPGAAETFREAGPAPTRSRSNAR